MHEKGVNVCVMPDNVQELLLDGYQTKQDIRWQCDLHTPLGPTRVNGHNFNDALVSPTTLKSNHISFECANSVTDVNHQLQIANCRNCSTGIKRSRDESPCSEEDSTNFSPHEMPLKIQQRSPERCNYSDSFHSKNAISPSKSYCNGSVCPTVHLSDDNRQLHSCEFVSSTNKPFDDCSIHGFNVNATESTISVIDNYSSNSNSCLETKTPKNCMGNENIISDFNEVNQKSTDGKEKCDCLKYPSNGTVMTQSIDDHEIPLHPGLRLSLFPHVPPYIKFATYDSKGEQFPPRIHKLLRWKLSKITPVVVRKVVANSGFRLLKKSTYWGGTWGKHTRSVGFKTLFDYQKMNHFPGTFQIGRKDRLWKSMQKLMSKFGKQKFDLMPTTYVLPQDKKCLRLVWKKNGTQDPWIVKPPASARGTGIRVVHKWCQIPDNVPLIVQKYISNPFLINETKFDLRLYVLITSVNPLRIYLYDNGLVRFASVKYSTELATLGDRYMHLTNYSINKLSSKYKQNEDAHACQGHKWTLKTLWNYMETELNVDVKTLWQRLIDLIIKTIISGEHTINQLSSTNLGSRYNSYELFGIDVLFDTELKPWLLEVNISPSLHSASPLDLAVKAPMVHDLMNIVGFQIPRSKKFSEEQLCEELGPVPKKCLCMDTRLYSTAITISEKCKHNIFIEYTRQEYLRKIIEDLTPDDIRHLIQYEDELTQLGSFQKIFPTPSTHEYLQYFDNPRYYNLLFDAWETKYSDCREEGIRLLQSKCEEGIHLRVPKAGSASSKIYEIPLKCVQRRQKIPNSVSVEISPCNRKFHTPPSCPIKRPSFAVNPRDRLRRRPLAQSKTYQLRSRKHKV